MSPSQKIELLAPVGTVEALRAAVQNGADAVYLGGRQFSARQYAANFTLPELKEAIRYAHLHGVSVYIAVNTLIDNAEFTGLIEYLYEIYRLDVDAVIVQDLGAASVIHRLLPELELHASTQMTIHNAAGARLMGKMGFSRVILAREVSLENIRLMKMTGKPDLEVFIHGALCVSYSGQCLMSSMIGGRSGNRGRCAQPCRLPYVLVNSAGQELAAGHLLSTSDLNMLSHLPLLAQAGVASLKIEGRMKRPEYVATVVRNYRQALDAMTALPPGDEYQADPGAMKELFQIFNRDFTTGYFLEEPGPHLMSYQRPNNRGLYLGRVVDFSPRGNRVTINLEEPLCVGDGYEIWVTKGGRIAGQITELWQDGCIVEETAGGKVTFTVREGRPQRGDRVFKILDKKLVERARKTFSSLGGIRRFPLKFSLYLKHKAPLRLTAEDEKGNRAEVYGEHPLEKAENRPLTKETAAGQLGRLGNTVFYLAELVMDGADDLMVPISELNNLRRKAVEILEEKRLSTYKNPFIREDTFRERVAALKKELPPETGKMKGAAQISVTVGDMDSVQAALEAGAKVVYFGGERLRHKRGILPRDFSAVVKACHKKGAEAVLMLPRLFQEEKAAEVREYCLAGKEAGVNGFLVGNPGSIELARELDLKGLRGDYTLNVFNDYTVMLLADYELIQLALSPELTLGQIRNIKCPERVRLECLVHGRMPLMITEHCAVGNLLGKGHRKRGCPLPCTRESYGLKDRMKMVFPLDSDENCRMYVYNPKTLRMLDRLPGLLECGVSLLRIEAKREEADWISTVVGLYEEEIRRCYEMGEAYTVREENLRIMNRLAPEGFTTGHYYRGVL